MKFSIYGLPAHGQALPKITLMILPRLPCNKEVA